MANPVVSAAVPVAANSVKKFYLPSQHLTTSNFFQFNIAYARQIKAGSHGKLRNKTFIRTVPLDKPCLGSASIHNRAFFVPYRVVWQPFTDFISDVAHVKSSGSGIIPFVPRVSFSVLQALFFNLSSAYFNRYYAVGSDVNDYDMYDGTNYIKLTPYGRWALKFLESLGYRGFINSASREVSCLPILCVAKIFMDYYYPSAYAHYGNFARIDGYFQREDTWLMNASELDAILSAIYVCAYSNDFFSAVWDNPVAPNPSTGSIDFSIPDITLAFPLDNYAGTTTYPITGQKVSQSSNGTPYIVGNTRTSQDNYRAVSPMMSQYLDSSLKALTSYISRNRLAGSRALDRYLLRYGIALSAEKLRRCIYLGEDIFPFEIGDVMSTSDTSADGGASLGAYAGKGIAYTNGKDFDFDSDEFGFVFVISSIIPDVSYVQGIDRNVMDISKLDFITDEFDGLGPAAVIQSEVVSDYGDSSFNSAHGNDVFGFAPRYYHWKIPYDRLTGDFNVRSISLDLLSWSTARLFNAADYATSGLQHNLDFVLGLDGDSYDRIFLGYNSKDSSDPFFVVHRAELELFSPMKPLYDSYDFEQDLNEGKQVVHTEPNGVKLN